MSSLRKPSLSLGVLVILKLDGGVEEAWVRGQISPCVKHIVKKHLLTFPLH